MAIEQAIPNYFSGPNCEGCSFRSRTVGYCEPAGNRDAFIVSVGEGPGKWETAYGSVFMGATGFEYNTWLAQAKLSRSDTYLTNGVRCRTIEYEKCQHCKGTGRIKDREPCPTCSGSGELPVIQKNGDFKNAPPSNAQVQECMHRYGHDDLLTMPEQPRLLVAMGDSALYALTGLRGISEYHGYVLPSTYGPVLALFHPSYILQGNQSLRSSVYRAMRRIPALAAKAAVKIETDYRREAGGLVTDIVSLARSAPFKSRPSYDAYNLGVPLAGGGLPVMDFEGWGANIETAAFSWGPGTGVSIPVNSLAEVIPQLDGIVGHNAYQHDLWQLHLNKLPIPRIVVDTLVLAHHANPSTPNKLSFVTQEYAAIPPDEYWKTEHDYATDKEGVALRDVDHNYRALLGLEKSLRVTNQWHMIEENAIPLTRLAFDVRVRGVRIDRDLLEQEANNHSIEAARLGAELHEKTGIELPKKTKTGLPSHQALKKHLYQTMQFPAQYDHKTHQKLTTDKWALNRLLRWARKDGNKDAIYFFETLQTAKLFSSQAINFRKYDVQANRIHAQLLLGRMDDDSGMGGTVTGRLSYRLPSLHQVPKYARKIFRADPGMVFIEADFRQIELAALMYLIGAWDTLRLYLAGHDFHSLTASRMPGIEELAKKLGKTPRDLAKIANFATVNGQGVETTADRNGLDEAVAQQLQDGIFHILPGYKPWRRGLIKQTKALGHYRSPYDWIRYFSEDDDYDTSGDSWTNIDNEIVNTPIQSIAGLRTRYALIELNRELPRDTHIMMTVHDSIVLQTPIDQVTETHDLIRDVMQRPTSQLPAPEVGQPGGLRFGVDVGVGLNWGELVKYEEWRQK